MKLFAVLPTGLLLATLSLAVSSCIYVRVIGGQDEDWGDDDAAGFHDLKTALEGCLVDPEYDLDLVASPWRKEADWTVAFVPAGSDEHAAFRQAREAVLARIEREGGTLTEQHEDGPHDWSCTFRVDGEPGEASVKLADSEEAKEGRSRQIEVSWEESD